MGRKWWRGNGLGARLERILGWEGVDRARPHRRLGQSRQPREAASDSRQHGLPRSPPAVSPRLRRRPNARVALALRASGLGTKGVTLYACIFLIYASISMLCWHESRLNMKNDDSNGSSGRSRSGEARMAKLSPSQRRNLAKTAAETRWAAIRDSPIYQPEAVGDLPIVGQTIPCAVIVVEGEIIRLVSERELVKSLGGKRGGSHWLRAKQDAAAANLPPILSASNLRPFIGEELWEGLNTRYHYKVGSRAIAYGLRGELYPMICDVFLKARDAKELLDSQDEIARTADILMRALAHTGIIALIDEATGYQKKRAVDGLARILEAFIAKELQPYIRGTFKPEFYEGLFRLRGLDYQKDTVKRPQYFGCLTNDIVYRRLAPGVLEELKKVATRNEAGRPTHKYFQRLTSNVGYMKLVEHLGAVVATMKLSSTYADFIEKLDKVAPRYGQNWLLPFPDQQNDTGFGL